MGKVNVPLAGRSYSIHAGQGLLASLGNHCRRLRLGDRCAVLTDGNVGPIYGDGVIDALRAAGFDPLLVTVPAGEGAKHLKVVSQCYDQLATHRLERRSFVVALGGGVVGDLAGFVAATFLRGIDFIQVPTTLLAQVDSSVGGKVGVNLRAGKNLVGAFHQPRLVLCDLDTLTTLPDREYRAGLAEVIKYGIIRDPALFGKLERHMPGLLMRNPTLLSDVVVRCCRIKADVVGADETEQGVRAILNFGHTIGHALEAISGYGRFLHGEAISIGQVLATRLSREALGLSAKDAARIIRLFEAAGLPIEVQLRQPARRALVAAMKHDKKVSDGTVKFVLVPRLGEARHGIRLDMDQVEQVIAGAGKVASWRQ